ncbi:MAG: PhoPQ-activated pathogenicity-related family protein [Bacteroidales bacterium]|jgi:PhoPQ-activated pathogenicity-related protein|nr:PhoPQ-activated pathogenicity-related family protein [Bacteroidales bacterium]
MQRLISGLFALLFSIGVVFAQPVNDPATALQRYLNKGDTSYGWKLRDSISYRNIKGYVFELTSQTWRDREWRHEMTIIIPNKIKSDGALLWVTGNGNDENGHPKFRKITDAENLAMAQIAISSGSITAVLHQVPNQPLFDNLDEGDLMPYSLQQYKDTKDDSWPVFFPMTKSVVRAMDAVQEFVKKRRNADISRFVISGASKRGWVTWLAAATGDQRITAIAPAVIELVNMPVQLDHQLTIFGDERNGEAKAIAELGISAANPTPDGQAIATMVDPYSYLKKITVPKLIIIAGNDNYWAIDAFRFYEKEIEGDYRLCIVPNVPHALGDAKQALGTLNLFFKQIVGNEPLPKCEWSMNVKKGVAHLTVEGTKDGLLEIALWTAESPTQDFRKAEWVKTKLSTKKKAKVTAEIPLPENGYKAFFVEIRYKAPEAPGSFTTRAYVIDKKGEITGI